MIEVLGASADNTVQFCVSFRNSNTVLRLISSSLYRYWCRVPVSFRTNHETIVNHIVCDGVSVSLAHACSRNMEINTKQESRFVLGVPSTHRTLLLIFSGFSLTRTDWSSSFLPPGPACEANRSETKQVSHEKKTVFSEFTLKIHRGPSLPNTHACTLCTSDFNLYAAAPCAIA